MKGIEIREFCGDYALDIPMGEGAVYTIYFNSRRNAEMVKRIMEVDDSVPNVATVCDVVEVKHGTWIFHKDGSGTCNQCRKTQKSVWDLDNCQNYCGCCGAKMGEGRERE